MPLLRPFRSQSVRPNAFSPELRPHSSVLMKTGALPGTRNALIACGERQCRYAKPHGSGATTRNVIRRPNVLGVSCAAGPACRS